MKSTKQASLRFNKREVTIPFHVVGVPQFTTEEFTHLLESLTKIK